ncbi:magnesium transporter CorA family protein [Intestinibacillus massiliensis]|uniref:magnesium transporter CorA family protein n=1 Tax=Intestinibacillus massiliensis TaxID=1871029 RepID=UPI000B35007F|nr:magnesium transporter CorA family protein [Intestinibacillus massiliensis]MCB6366254.1 magnesium transporter CorA family protein [Intestinibacillus massiliensis]
MIEYYKTIGSKIEKLEGFTDGCWINMVRPSREEIEYIVDTLQVEEDFVLAALDPEESSRVESEEEQVLMIVDIPTIEAEDKDSGSQIFGTLPLGIVVVENAVITVCLQDTSITRSIAEGVVKDIHTALKTRFVFQLLLRVAGRFLRYLRLIERNFTKIEKRLYDSMKNEELIQLLGLSKSLVYFSTSLKANEVTMEKMLRGRLLKIYEDDRDILEDGLIEVRQAIEMASIYSSILSGTMDAYASVVSNNLNIIMKVLTVITIIMTIPNIIFGFYGMNIGDGTLPFGLFWWAPLVVTAIGCVFAWFCLKKKNLY